MTPHLDGQPFSQDTDVNLDHGQNPYAGYDEVDQPPFLPAANREDDRLLPKQRVVFVEAGNESSVAPFTRLEGQEPSNSRSAARTSRRVNCGSTIGPRQVFDRRG